MRNAHRIAEDLGRSLNYLKRLPGVLLWHNAELRVLTRIAPPDPLALAQTLIHLELNDPKALIQATGARDAWQVSPGKLGKASYHLKRVVQSSKTIKALIAEGARPLRHYRHVDFNAFVAQTTTQLDHLRICLGADEPLPLRAMALCSIAETHKVTDVKACVKWLEHENPERIRHRALAKLVSVSNALKYLPGHAVEAWQTMRASGIYHVETLCLALASGMELDAALDVLRKVPRSVLERIGPLAYRVGLFYGHEAGWHTLGGLVERWSNPRETRDNRHALQGFRRAVRAYVKASNRTLNPKAAALQRGLTALPRMRSPAARAFVKLLRDWMDGAESAGVPSHTQQYRVVARAWHLGLEEAAKVLVQSWLSAQPAQEVIPLPSKSWLSNALALRLLCPNLKFLALTVDDSDQLTNLYASLHGLSSARIAEVAPFLSELPVKKRTWGLRTLLESEIPAAELRRAITLGVNISNLSVFTPCPHQVAPYLDMVEQLPDGNIAGLAVDDDSFVALFTHDDLGASLALTLLSKTRLENQQRNLERLVALVQVLRHHYPELRHALELWQSPNVVVRPPEFDALQAALDLLPEQLETYLHYKRLSGEEEVFSKALLTPIAPKRQTQIHWLTQKLTDPATTGKEREQLEARLNKLTQPDYHDAKQSALIQRARTRLNRATERLRYTSLNRILDDQTHRLLLRLLKLERLPTPLPSGLDLAVLLLYATDLDRPLWDALIRAVLLGQNLRKRTVNLAWETEARRAGIDVERWCQGIEKSIVLSPDETLYLTTEHNPLEVLRMGSYFGTCLSLESGSNAAATVANALDINKQVLYLRRTDGAVVGRKLIGATAKGELSGYKTFLQKEAHWLTPAIHAAVADFAQACNLQLSHTATPENLHDAFWYDDGNEAWIAGDNAVQIHWPSVPKHLPQDEDAEYEYVWVQATTPTNSLDVRRDLLIVLAQRERTPFSRSASALLRELAPNRESSELAFDEIIKTMRALQDDLSWWGETHNTYADYDNLVVAINALEPSRARTLEIAQRAQQCARNPPTAEQRRVRNDILIHATAGVVLLSTKDTLRFFQDIQTLARRTDLECFEEHPDCMKSWIDNWSETLLLTTLHSNPASLRFALQSKDPNVRNIALNTVIQRPSSGLSKTIRRKLKQTTPTTRPTWLLALGSQQQPKDQWRLLQYLKQQPTSLETAVGLLRCKPDAQTEARTTWQLPKNYPKCLDDRQWSILAAELEPDALIDALTEHDPMKATTRCFAGLRLLLAMASSSHADQMWSRHSNVLLGLKPLRALQKQRKQRWKTILHAATPEDLEQAVCACRTVENEAQNAVQELPQKFKYLGGTEREEEWLLPPPGPVFHRVWETLLPGRAEEAQAAAASLVLDWAPPKYARRYASLILALAGDDALRWPLGLRRRLAITGNSVEVYSTDILLAGIHAMRILNAEEQNTLFYEQGVPLGLTLSGGDYYGLIWHILGKPSAEQPSLLRHMITWGITRNPQYGVDVLEMLLSALPAPDVEAWLTVMLPQLTKVSTHILCHRRYGRRVSYQFQDFVLTHIIAARREPKEQLYDEVAGKEDNLRRDWLLCRMKALEMID